MELREIATQVIRTASQGAAGIIFALLLKANIEIDQDALLVVLTGLFSGLWAMAVSLGVKYVHPIIGLLSIIPTPPRYGDAVEVTGRRV